MKIGELRKFLAGIPAENDDDPVWVRAYLETGTDRQSTINITHITPSVECSAVSYYVILSVEDKDANDDEAEDGGEDDDDIVDPDDVLPMRTEYRNGQPIDLKYNGCDGCKPMSINGVFTHEPGCSEAWKDRTTECFECGCDFYPEGRFQDHCEGCMNAMQEAEDIVEMAAHDPFGGDEDGE